MNIRSYAAISLSDIRKAYVGYGGTEEEFNSFVWTVLDCVYTWGDSAHTLVSLEGFLENMAGEDETEWPSESWKSLYESLTVFTEQDSGVYVDLET
jgi:hypothetical protein